MELRTTPARRIGRSLDARRRGIVLVRARSSTRTRRDASIAPRGARHRGAVDRPTPPLDAHRAGTPTGRMSDRPIGSRRDFRALPGGGYGLELLDESVQIEFR